LFRRHYFRTKDHFKKKKNHHSNHYEENGSFFTDFQIEISSYWIKNFSTRGATKAGMLFRSVRAPTAPMPTRSLGKMEC
jgi:hypothetical protein